MTDLRQRFEQANDFLMGVELVSTRGMLAEARAEKTRRFAEELKHYAPADWVSITDNAGGHPMLAAAALGAPLRAAGREVVIHLTCKDINRNGLESEAWHLASEGLNNLLVLTGDFPGRGIGGGGKPAFDIDAVGLLEMLGQMNAGLNVTRPDAKQPARLERTNFFAGAAVTNFKLLENEVVPQLLKMERKIASGAGFFVNQIGFDARKMHELIAWARERGHGRVPLIGNVYVLNGTVARFFNQGQIPGVVMADALAELCARHASGADKGRAFFLELAAKQVAIYHGLGYRGAYLGGVHKVADLERVREIERGFGPDDWKTFAREHRFSRPGEYFQYAEDPATGLADPARPTPRSAPNARNITYAYRFSKFMHGMMFTPGRGLAKLGARLSAGAEDPRQGPAWMRAIEKTSKRMMFDCRDCGDCSLPETGFLCPESACAKNQRNGPCGGTRDGLCEVYDTECIWSRAYDRAKFEGHAEDLLAHAPVVQDQGLRYTSSWANTWLGRDHLAKPRPAAATAPTNSQPTPGENARK